MKISSPGRIRGIIFDWSGVLVDEIDAVADAHISTIRSLGGLPLTVDEWKRRVSRNWADIYLTQGIAPPDVAQAVTRFEYFYGQNLSKIKPVDGAIELLQSLKDFGVRLAILSNQFESCVLTCATQLGLSTYFDTIVAAREMQVPKDDLESARRILRLLDVPPFETLLVDDMEEGIELGSALGLITVGKMSTLRRELKDADLLINELSELLDIVKNPDLRLAIRRDLSLATGRYRAVYEAREKDKATGRIRRLPEFYHAENAALVRFVGRRHRTNDIGTMVDVGCGASNHAMKAASRFGCKAIRLDLTLRALQRTRTLTSWQQADPADRAQVVSVQADAARLPLRDACSDMTFCTELLEHVVAPHAVLEELARVTRAGGRLVVAVPNALSETARLFRSLLRKSYHSGHVREYTLDSLVDQVDKAGFDVLYAGTRWFLFYYLAFSLERASKPGISGLLLAKVPLLSKLIAGAIEPAIFLETMWFGARSRRGLGLLVLGTKR